MSMAPGHIYPLVSSFLLLCICIMVNSCSGVEGHDGDELQALDTGYTLEEVLNMTQPNTDYNFEVPRSSFKIVYRFDPSSPSNSVTFDNIVEILRHDMRRAAYLQHRVSTIVDLQQELVQTTIPIIPIIEIGSPLFYILVGLGTPKRIQTIDFDTGSSFSWIQCHPCQPCKRQHNPLFDPTQSHSYRTVSCNDLACTQLPPNMRGCTNNICTYNISYQDSDSTKGIVSREQLSLPTFAGDRFPNFVFGCGHQNMVRGLRSSGLVGLGRGFHSLVTQTSNRFGHSFSYCLPSSVNVRGYLTLGHNEDASRTIYTPMLRNSGLDTGFYFINLTAISIDNIHLPMPAWFIMRHGTVIDSGTVVTRLPADMYRQLRSVFRQGMSRYQYQPAPAHENMDTCYSINKLRFPYPSITLHFDGHADLMLSFDQILFNIYRKTYCLAFTELDQRGFVAIIGSLQQRGMEVIYNIEEARIGFYRTTNCR